MAGTQKGWLKKQDAKKNAVKRETCAGAIGSICDYCVSKEKCPFGEGHSVVRCGAFVRKENTNGIDRN